MLEIQKDKLFSRFGVTCRLIPRIPVNESVCLGIFLTYGAGSDLVPFAV